MRDRRASLLATMLLCAGPACVASGASAPSVEVQTAPVVRKVLSETVAAYGTVTIGPQVFQNITFPRAGQISKLDVRQNEQVKVGQPLVELTEDAAAQASFESAKAAVDFAERDLAKLKSLRQKHFATNAQVAAAQKTVDDAKVTLDKEKKLGTNRLTTIAQAPFDGFVAALSVAPGDRVQAGASLMKIARTDGALAVTAGLEPEDARRIRPGMDANASPIFAEGVRRPIHGKVRGVSATTDPATKLVDVWIDLDARAADLAPGTKVAVSIVLAGHDGLAVPRNAVLHDQKGDYLFQVSNGAAHRVAVQTGIQTDSETEVTGTVDSREPVVVGGAHELKDGMAVRSSPSTPAR